MRVYGYTHDKETVAVDLSIDDIVAAGIDPWRLDLFDPDPVSFTVAGKRLYFRRLQNVCLAYKTAELQVMLGVHDGSTSVCVEGELGWLESGLIKVHNIRPAAINFSELYRTYLAFQSQTAARKPVATPDQETDQLKAWLVTMASPQQQAELFCGGVLVPLAAAALRLQGSILNLDLHQNLNRFQFFGEMFGERKAPFKLPHQINWVLNELAPWNPIVSFDLRALLGARLSYVHIFLDPAGIAELKQRFGQDNFTVVPFQTDGISCYAWSKADVWVRSTLGKAGAVHKWSEDWFSIANAQSCAPNEVLCSRIGFFDLARQQARHQSYSRNFFREEYRLLLRGFRVLDGPWTDFHKQPLVYRILNRCVPATRLLWRAVAAARGFCRRLTRGTL